MSPEQQSVRPAKQRDLAWINSRYGEVGFMPSNIETDFIGVAEVGGEPAGVGRLVRINDADAELGGMLVFESFRGLGLADRIIDYLLDHGDQYARIFCLPFAHLQGLYTRHGFASFDSRHIAVPDVITRKHQWCNQTYPAETLLLLRTNST